MEAPVQKGEQLWSGEGIAIWATDLADKLILEFDDASVGEVAYAVQMLLRRHALNSSFLERLEDGSFLIRRVEPLPLELVAESAPGQTSLLFRGSTGEALGRDQLLAVDGVSAKRVEMMEDLVIHAARSLRAHLTLHGVDHLRLVMRFGITGDGACLAQVVNPRNCDLGTTDMVRLANLLGG